MKSLLYRIAGILAIFWMLGGTAGALATLSPSDITGIMENFESPGPVASPVPYLLMLSAGVIIIALVNHAELSSRVRSLETKVGSAHTDV